MSDAQPFKCEMPGCTRWTSREPHVCTKHLIEGYGRLPDMPIPEAKPEYDTGEKLACPECGKICSSKFGLQSHQRSHRGKN